MTFSIIGGDKRQVYLASFLIDAGHQVLVYGLPPYLLHPECHIASSLREAVHSSHYIIAPIPMTGDQKNLTALEPFHIGLKDFLSCLEQGQMLIAGTIPYQAADYCDQNKIAYWDLMKENQVAILNAVATAEGAVMKAIEKSSITLHKNRCLVMGYGRCGQVLADKLKGLSACVTIAARKPEALAKARSLGYECIHFHDLPDKIFEYSFLFNTVPYCVLTESLLKKAQKDVVIIDIASSPGGINYDAAKSLGINATLYLGIPGKIAPKSSAAILGEKILERINL